MEKYNKLRNNGFMDDESKARAEQFADLLNEIKVKETELNMLRELRSSNYKDNCGKVWTTEDGFTRAIHNLSDNHLKNINRFLTNKGKTPSAELAREILSRTSEWEKDPNKVIVEDYEGEIKSIEDTSKEMF